MISQDVAKCLLVCGVTYNNETRPARVGFSSPSSSPLDTSSLAALATAKVTSLSLSRSSDPDIGAASDKSSGTNSSVPGVVGKLGKKKKGVSAEGGRGKGGGAARQKIRVRTDSVAHAVP